MLIEEKDMDPPTFNMSERYHGFTLILCYDQFALDFIRITISVIEAPWEGAKIEIKTLKELPAPRKIKILSFKDIEGENGDGACTFQSEDPYRFLDVSAYG